MTKLSRKDKQLVARMRAAGIVNPIWTLEAARAAKLPIAVACALLEQETGGGHNVFGHDVDPDTGRPVWHGKRGRVDVTRTNYAAYIAFRERSGNRKMQGVGPTQLTWYTLQDLADKLGGCWHPRWNMEVGFTHAASLVRRLGLRRGLRDYNGSGPAAERYAATMVEHRIPKWERLLKAPAPAPKPKRPLIPIRIPGLKSRDWWRQYVYGDVDCERPLLVALANVAKDYGQGAKIRVRSGKRTRTEQELLYRLYLSGKGNLAARPGTSNHEPRPPRNEGMAADCGLVYRNGREVNIGDDARARSLMRKRGLCLPVRGETWHVERGSRWAA